MVYIGAELVWLTTTVGTTQRKQVTRCVHPGWMSEETAKLSGLCHP